MRLKIKEDVEDSKNDVETDGETKSNSSEQILPENKKETIQPSETSALVTDNIAVNINNEDSNSSEAMEPLNASRKRGNTGRTSLNNRKATPKSNQTIQTTSTTAKKRRV